MNVLLFLAVLAAAVLSSSTFDHKIINIDSIGFEKLHQVKEGAGCPWIEIGDKLLVVCSTSVPVHIVHSVYKTELQSLQAHTLLHHLGVAVVVDISAESILSELSLASAGREKKVEAFEGKSVVVVRQTANNPAEVRVDQHPEAVLDATPIGTLVNLVSSSRWFSDVTTLASYNRYTKGTGITAAQNWIASQLSGLRNVTVTTQPFTSGSTSGVNVIGTIRGSVTPDNWVIIGAHYDSISHSPTSSAPGAEDDGSGTAAVLEMARIISAYPPPSTVFFILYSGEEQGLLGSAAHAQGWVNSGDRPKLKLMHDMDMIAYQKTATGPNQVILETTAAFTSLFPYYRESAQRFTTLRTYESTNAFGSDHESYLRRNMPALLTIDYDWDSYPSYHRTTDTPDKLNQNLGYQIVKLGLGAAAQALGYPF